jgi:hypothetical protein
MEKLKVIKSLSIINKKKLRLLGAFLVVAEGKSLLEFLDSGFLTTQTTEVVNA